MLVAALFATALTLLQLPGGHETGVARAAPRPGSRLAPVFAAVHVGPEQAEVAKAAAEVPGTGDGPARVVVLRNLHTGEVLSISGGQLPPRQTLDRFMRCHHTGQITRFDPRLVRLVLAAAAHFRSDRIEVVSAFRHPSYNELLRRRGRGVARRSLHMSGRALDFRIPGTSTLELRRFALAARLGGVGYYPGSRFVHIDVGKRRTWGSH
jgi:uncharacterized protein YcbK (DUF882 family)